MGNIKKILFILLITILTTTIIIPSNIYAFDIPSDLDKYATEGGTSYQFFKLTNNIVRIIHVVGSIISVIVLIVIGIKYMYCSVEERADYKRTMVPYLVGAIMVFGISNITGILYYLAINII